MWQKSVLCVQSCYLFYLKTYYSFEVFVAVAVDVAEVLLDYSTVRFCKERF